MMAFFLLFFFVVVVVVVIVVVFRLFAWWFSVLSPAVISSICVVFWVGSFDYCCFCLHSDFFPSGVLFGLFIYVTPGIISGWEDEKNGTNQPVCGTWKEGILRSNTYWNPPFCYAHTSSRCGSKNDNFSCRAGRQCSEGGDEGGKQGQDQCGCSLLYFSSAPWLPWEIFWPFQTDWARRSCNVCHVPRQCLTFVPVCLRRL